MQAPAAGEEGGTPPCEKPVLPWRLEPGVQFPCPAQKENDRICHTGILKMETTGAWRVPVERTEEPGLAAPMAPTIKPTRSYAQRPRGHFAAEGGGAGTTQAAPTCESGRF